MVNFLALILYNNGVKYYHWEVIVLDIKKKPSTFWVQFPTHLLLFLKVEVKKKWAVCCL